MVLAASQKKAWRGARNDLGSEPQLEQEWQQAGKKDAIVVMVVVVVVVVLLLLVLVLVVLVEHFCAMYLNK